MRPRRFLFLALLTLVLAVACSQEPAPEKAPTKPAATTAPAPSKAEQTDKALEQAAKDVKQTVEQEAKGVKKEAETVAADTKSAVTEAVDSARKDATSALQTLNPPTSTPTPKAPGIVTYPASMGAVHFNHATHAGGLDCGKCHTHDPPQKIAINKEIAHTLCRGCHQDSRGKAPTACNGCHKK